MKDLIKNLIHDSVMDFVVYDRKECEDLPRGAIEELIKNGELTVDEMVSEFKTQLEKHLS